MLGQGRAGAWAPGRKPQSSFSLTYCRGFHTTFKPLHLLRGMSAVTHRGRPVSQRALTLWPDRQKPPPVHSDTLPCTHVYLALLHTYPKCTHIHTHFPRSSPGRYGAILRCVPALHARVPGCTHTSGHFPSHRQCGAGPPHLRPTGRSIRTEMVTGRRGSGEPPEIKPPGSEPCLGHFSRRKRLGSFSPHPAL